MTPQQLAPSSARFFAAAIGVTCTAVISSSLRACSRLCAELFLFRKASCPRTMCEGWFGLVLSSCFGTSRAPWEFLQPCTLREDEVLGIEVVGGDGAVAFEGVVNLVP